MTTLCCAVAAFSAASAATCDRSGEAIEPRVSTIAGTGFPGTVDGAALAGATFVEPVALARARDGSLYVADAGAQNIRRLFQGRVTTVAGISEAGASPDARVGGFADGPADRARFNRPTGIAVANDGTIYVADSLNRAIRKIKDGVVTTIAKDQLDEPRGIAIDDAGAIFVADRGTGIRQLLPDGTLSALDTISGASDRLACGVAVAGSGSGRELAYTDTTTLHVLQGTRDRSIKFDDPVEPIFEKRSLGRACALAIVDADSLVVSDLSRNAVRFVRLELGTPVAEPPTTRILASGTNDLTGSVGGFADGPSSTASMDDPRGVIVLPNGIIAVADSGNRRLRLIEGVDARHPISPDATGTLATPAFATDRYRVVVISNSFAFSNAMWPDSIAGHVERGLIDAKIAGTLPVCPQVVTYRFSASGISEIASFLATYYGDGESDLVVIVANGGMVGKDIARAIRLRPVPGSDPTNVNSLANEGTGWRSDIVSELQALRKTLASNKTSLEVVFAPDARAVSPLENVQSDTIPPTLVDFYSDARPAYSFTYKIELDFEKLLASSGVRTLPLLRTMMEAEARSNREALFNEQDYHPSKAGDRFIGTSIVTDLLRWKPWAPLASGGASRAPGASKP